MCHFINEAPSQESHHNISHIKHQSKGSIVLLLYRFFHKMYFLSLKFLTLKFVLCFFFGNPQNNQKSL